MYRTIIIMYIILFYFQLVGSSMSPTLNDGAGSEQRDIVLAEHYSRFHGKLKRLGRPN